MRAYTVCVYATDQRASVAITHGLAAIHTTVLPTGTNDDAAGANLSLDEMVLMNEADIERDENVLSCCQVRDVN